MKALIAMSGGVDSSVAAYLMKKEGYDCVGITMKLFHGEEAEKDSKTCCSLDDVEDARAVAFRIGIPYHVYNFTDDFKEKVIDKFVATYEAGGTPNPCIDCNRYIKFERLFRTSKELGCDKIVTGHYARIEEQNGRYILKKALDATKDQTYVLYSLTQEQLSHTILPLGGLTKDEARELAREIELVNADKPDSQDICFVPDGDYAGFMERYTGKVYPPGDFIDLNGKKLGTHSGAVRYTIGQRKGLGLAMGEPVYVCAKDMAANTVTIGANSDLFGKELMAGDVNWISVEELKEPMRVSAKIRYRAKEQPATVYPLENGQVKVIFDEPQRAITKGQAVVFYDGDVVVGGGTIL